MDNGQGLPPDGVGGEGEVLGKDEGGTGETWGTFIGNVDDYGAIGDSLEPGEVEE